MWLYSSLKLTAFKGFVDIFSHTSQLWWPCRALIFRHVVCGLSPHPDDVFYCFCGGSWGGETTPK